MNKTYKSLKAEEITMQSYDTQYQNSKYRMRYSLISSLLAVSLFTANAWAEKPDHAGNPNKGGKQSQQDKQYGRDDGRQQAGDRQGGRDHGDGGNVDVRVNAYFGDNQRSVVRDYYSSSYRGGHCPPGLAKKRNGCMPPGQAKKWRVGHALPRDVVYYDLPPRVIIDLGAPPVGYKYVRVAADILLIAIGTGMVIDAIQDLSSL